METGIQIPTKGRVGQWACDSMFLERAGQGSGDVGVGACRGQGSSGHVNAGAWSRQTGAVDMLTEMPAEGRGGLWACQSRSLLRAELGIVCKNAGACRDQRGGGYVSTHAC